MKKTYNLLLTALLCSIVTIAQAQTTTLTQAEAEALYTEYFEDATPTHVTVHDPSVVIGYEASDGTVSGEETSGSTKVYYIFGSHLAWAKSYDLQNWETFTNNITTDYATIFAEDAEWSALGTSDTYDVSGNMWAPDVIWNKEMGKWCMYMSINGDNWYTSVVMLTSESLDGDWTRVGPVVYSGFEDAETAAKTDLYEVLGDDAEFPSRYIEESGGGNRLFGLNAIDPCVFYDEDGNMWMTYGSWFGGLYMLRLDASTGLRDKTYTYELKGIDETTAVSGINVASDPYQGIKLAGGYNVTGEASYIQYYNGYYYLFVTYGGLTSTGGYNMRLFKSTSVTGPYTDLNGQDARYWSGSSTSNTSAGQMKRSVGTKMMTYYQWSFMDYGYTAEGHNSAIVDTDGKMYLVYHTRFNDGTEGHQVRVHQLFQTAAGGVTAAPFEYKGETLATEAYSTSDVAGTYHVILHDLTDYANLVCNEEGTMVLAEDGTISGDYSGTWSLSTTAPQITFSITGSSKQTFDGVLIEQALEETNYKTLCFTAQGNTYDQSFWGYRLADNGQIFSDDAILALEVNNLGTISTTGYKNYQMPLLTESSYGATFTWTSTNTALISDDGLVADITADAEVVMNLTITSGDYQVTIPVTMTLKAEEHPYATAGVTTDHIVASYTSSTDYNNNAEALDAITDETGVSVSFYVSGLDTDWDQIAYSTDNLYILYLSVLHYDYADTYEAAATMSSAASNTGVGAWQLFLNGSYYVTVSYNPDGTIDFYRDGVLMLTYAATTTSGWYASTSRTTAEIAAAAIDYFKNGEIVWAWSVSDIVIGYSVDYDAPAKSDAIAYVSADSNLSIKTEGLSVVVEGDVASDVLVYDLSGRLVARGTTGRTYVGHSGLYIVRVGNVAQKVILK